MIAVGVGLVLLSVVAGVLATAGYPALWREAEDMGRERGWRAQRLTSLAIAPPGIMLLLSGCLVRRASLNQQEVASLKRESPIAIPFLLTLLFIGRAWRAWDTNRTTDSWIARVAFACHEWRWWVTWSAASVLLSAVICWQVCRAAARPAFGRDR
jgi:hypothetical protein